LSEQALDLKRSWHIVRRHWITIGAMAALGLIVGAGYTVVKPPVYASTALVALPTSTHDIATQVVVAGSDVVLAGALRTPGPGESLQTLRRNVRVSEVTANILSVTGLGSSARAAERTANDVAASYVSYVHSKGSAGGVVAANLFQPAIDASRTSVVLRLAAASGLGVLAGALAGALGVVAMSRGDRRLWRRDELADAVGAPVLASFPVWRPADAANWASLIETYEPSVAQAWRIRNTLYYLGLFDVISDRTHGPDQFSVTVLSLAADRRALSVGPQLAVSAAAQGIPAALVVGPQPHAASAAALRSAVASQAPKRAGLQLAVADAGGSEVPPGAAVTVVTSVLNGSSRQLGALHTSVTLLAISAGAVTAEQLAVAASRAAAAGHPIDGIVVADPEPGDHTTGRVPQVTRSAHLVTPNRLSSVMTESR
jgi:capsular polysaccharide biosynthesis protein